MDSLERDRACFSGRVWQEIERAVASVKVGNCTARRFLEIDGPYGPGLTAISGDDDLIVPRANEPGASPDDWDVRRPVVRPNAPPYADPDERLEGRGTYLVESMARPLAMIATEFLLSTRSVEAFDDECQPLDLSRVVRAARDLALEEERLIYYGNVRAGYPSLLRPHDREDLWQQIVALRSEADAAAERALLGVAPPEPFDTIQEMILAALQKLARRGFAGPYTLVVSPEFYAQLFVVVEDRFRTLVEAFRELFPLGVHMVPAIRHDPNGSLPEDTVLGAIIAASRSYVRLVVGQDWATAYRGKIGVYHRFLLSTSLRLEITGPGTRGIELLVTERPQPLITSGAASEVAGRPD